MSEKNYSISTKAVSDHLRALFNKDRLCNHENGEHILNVMLTLPEHSINTILMLTMLNEVFIPFKKGDYVIYKPSEYSSQFGDRDILMDKGLMTPEGYIYGTIMSDGSWSTTDPFNPYSAIMKVDFHMWKDGKLSWCENNTQTDELILIKEFPDFNSEELLDFLEIEVTDPEEITI
jgi:hypothetical protein